MEAYTPQELREKISSNDYGAELCLQHAMLCIEKLSRDAERWHKAISAYERGSLISHDGRTGEIDGYVSLFLEAIRERDGGPAVG